MLIEIKEGLVINTSFIKSIKLTQTNELNIIMIDGEIIWLDDNGKEILKKIEEAENGNWKNIRR